MGEHAHAVADELGAVPADVLAMADVFIGEFFGGGQGEGLLFLDGFARRAWRRGPGPWR